MKTFIKQMTKNNLLYDETVLIDKTHLYTEKIFKIKKFGFIDKNCVIEL